MNSARGEVKPLRIHQAVAAQLGTAILSGEHKPGDILHSEVEHAHQLGVSRTAYREATRILIAKGLLEGRPRTGTVITPRHRWNLLDPDILAWMFANHPDEQFIRDLFELRGIIEPAAAALAAKRRTGEQLGAIAEALAGMARHGVTTSQGQQADQRFHRAILAAAGNEALASLSSSIVAAMHWTSHFTQRNSRRPRDPLPDHAAVYGAIAQGDDRAASLTMTDLLRIALEDLIDIDVTAC